MGAKINVYSKNRLNGKDSAGNVKATLPALFLTDYQNATKFKELFYCDEVWIQKDSENKQIINGLVEENGTNLSMRDVKRKGNLRIRKDNKNYVVLNDAGLNTYAKTEKPVVLWKYQGLFKFTEQIFSAYYSFTKEYGIYIKNKKNNLELKYPLGFNIASKMSAKATKIIPDVADFNQGDTIVVTAYAVNEEGERKLDSTEFIVGTPAEIQSITKVSDVSSNPNIGDEYSMLFKDSDYTQQYGLDFLYASKEGQEILTTVNLIGHQGSMDIETEQTFLPLPTGLYSGINKTSIYILTHIGDNGRPDYWIRSTYIPITASVSASIDIRFTATSQSNIKITEYSVTLTTNRAGGFASADSINITSVTLKQFLDSGSFDIQLPIDLDAMITAKVGDYSASYYKDGLSIIYPNPQAYTLPYYEVTFGKNTFDGLEIKDKTGDAPQPNL